MATGQTLLDTMELVNQELQLQSGEVDVTRGLIALNRAQDYFESLLAQKGISLASTGTVTTSASTETTAFPTGLLRLDSLQLLDSNGRVERTLRSIDSPSDVGQSSWPFNIISASPSTGKPSAFWTNKTNIYWHPLPDATYTVRWYGLQAASDITAGGTFAYDDMVILPLASFACRLMKLGVEDNIGDIAQVAQETFSSVLNTLSTFNRTGAQRLNYTEYHNA